MGFSKENVLKVLEGTSKPEEAINILTKMEENKNSEEENKEISD
jgi:hypothetical protein